MLDHPPKPNVTLTVRPVDAATLGGQLHTGAQMIFGHNHLQPDVGAWRLQVGNRWQSRENMIKTSEHMHQIWVNRLYKFMDMFSQTNYQIKPISFGPLGFPWLILHEWQNYFDPTGGARLQAIGLFDLCNLMGRRKHIRKPGAKIFVQGIHKGYSLHMLEKTWLKGIRAPGGSLVISIVSKYVKCFGADASTSEFLF